MGRYLTQTTRGMQTKNGGVVCGVVKRGLISISQCPGFPASSQEFHVEVENPGVHSPVDFELLSLE